MIAKKSTDNQHNNGIDIGWQLFFKKMVTRSLTFLKSDNAVNKHPQSLSHIMVGKSAGIDKERRNYVTVTQCLTRNAWQSLAYSPLGAVVSPPSEYL